MAEKKEIPEEVPEEAFGAFVSAITSPNPRPDTAQGVAEMIEKVSELIEDRSRSQLVTVETPEDAHVPARLAPNGGFEVINPAVFHPYMSGPLSRRGTARMTSIVSFVNHINRFGDEDSAVFACDDRENPSLTAVLNYHRADRLPDEEAADSSRVHGEYRFGDHRTHFAFPLSDEWQAWQERDGETMTMGEFAMFLEDRIGDIALIEDGVPESAQRFVETNGGAKMIADYGTLIELARGLRINENSVVEEAINLSSGEGQIRLSNEHVEAKVGQSVIKVPTMFFIAIPVFRNGDFYRLPARLRYRKTSTGLTFRYDLWRSDRAFDTAFRENVAKVDAATEAQVFFGSPE